MNRVNAEISDLPIARIDAQELEQSLPIREYLEQNGCAVVVNRKPAIMPAYHIICGDADFVKETVASLMQSDVKLFVVLFLRNKEKFPEPLGGIGAKIAVVSGTALSTRDAHQLFAYFFTGDEKIFFLEHSVSPMMEIKNISPIIEESLMQDGERVSRVIGEMFGKEEKMKAVHTPRQKSKTHPALKASLLTVCTIAAPVIWYLTSLTVIAAVQWYGVSALKKGDVSRAETVTRLTQYWLGQGKGSLTVIALPARLFSAGTFMRSQERVLSVIGDIVTAENKAAEFVAGSGQVAPLLFARPDEGSVSGVSLPVAIDRMRLALDGLMNALGLAGAQLRLIATDNQFPFIIPPVGSMALRAEVEIAEAAAQAGALRHLLTLYRAAGGFDRKKTYLVLLQNSMELRPTGGFIGSVATMSVEEGMMEMPVVQDVYALDGQLKGHVDPPVAIKELLQQEHWYLRDSNWDPDFRASGQRAAWFYEKETGSAVDGVIAISTPLLTDLLGVIGPLDLADYNDRITKENFFGKSLFYTKTDFFPGSTQKKDFLGSLMVVLVSRLTSGAFGDAPALMRVVSRALAGGDIQFWFPDRQTQAIAEQAGWAGEVTRQEPCETSSPPCMVERVALVESNMGVNKVNFFIKRSVKSRVDVGEDGGVEGAIALTYQNTSTDDAALSGGGVYLSYARVYLAADARVSSVLVDGAEVPYTSPKTSGRTMPYRDADTTEHGSTVVGLAFPVPPGMEKTVTVIYRRGIPLAFTNNESTLAVSIRKQPGMTNTNLDLAVSYPVGWSLATKGFLANAAEVRYNTVLDQTKVFTVRFLKK